MQEILFRGKDRTGILNNQWLYGSLDNTDKENPQIIYTDRFGNKCFVIVTPKTVGQYTGLTDKNGKRIFEGDIISNRHEKGVVTANIHNCGCCHSVYGFAVCDENGEPNDSIGFGGNYDEVIGNIHDNPDLLK